MSNVTGARPPLGCSDVRHEQRLGVVKSSPAHLPRLACRYTARMRLPLRFHIGGVICLAVTLYAAMHVVDTFFGAVSLWIVWWIPIGFLTWRAVRKARGSY